MNYFSLLFKYGYHYLEIPFHCCDVEPEYIYEMGLHYNAIKAYKALPLRDEETVIGAIFKSRLRQFLPNNALYEYKNRKLYKYKTKL